MTCFEKSGYSGFPSFPNVPPHTDTNLGQVWEHQSYSFNCSPIEGPKVINTNRSAAVLPEFSPAGRIWVILHLAGTLANFTSIRGNDKNKSGRKIIPVLSNNPITRQSFSVCRETLGLIWIISVNTLCGLLRHNALNCPLHSCFFFFLK